MFHVLKMTNVQKALYAMLTKDNAEFVNLTINALETTLRLSVTLMREFANNVLKTLIAPMEFAMEMFV